ADGARVRARDDSVRGDEAPPRFGRGGSRGHAPFGPREAAFPQCGSDPADPRPLDRQIHPAPRGFARGGQGRIGGNCMSTMVEQTTQVYSVFIRATPDQVWDAITKPEFTSKYFYGSITH